MIDDDVVRARIPRLGTITTGRGQEATSRQGRAYARPTRAETLVFHTDDPELANAVQVKLGGDVLRDSPTWSYDVVTDAREAEVLILPTGFRQHLELWRAAECIRRCDGRQMSTLNGRPTAQPCACDDELAQGRERACKPTTILPSILDLDVERFGVWEIRSGSWGTAAAIKGTMTALQMVGATGGTVPAILSMVDRQVRDTERRVHDVVELHVTIAQSHRTLEALASRAAEAIGTPPTGELPAGDEHRRLELMQQWSDLQARAHRLGLREQLADDWRQMFGTEPRRDFGDLSVDELAGWVELVAGTVDDHEAILRREADEATTDAALEGEGPPHPAEAPAE